MIDSEALELPANGAQIMSEKKPALAYLRTSSVTNVGEDKDSDKRQMGAIEAYARRHGYVIELPPYYDAGVSGADPITDRPGFVQMLGYLREHQDVRTVLVENASRFARDLTVQLVGHDMLRGLGIELIPVDAPAYFTDETPTAVMVRQILGAVIQFQKSALVQQLRAARERKRAATGKCGGRKSHSEAHPATVALARSLRWINKRMRQKRSLRDVAATLAERGHVSSSGKPFGPSAIRSMLTG
jgi:DNA invertase Pin-like site-specific DNA recombinase